MDIGEDVLLIEEIETCSDEKAVRRSSMMLTPIRRRLQLSNISDSSADTTKSPSARMEMDCSSVFGDLSSGCMDISLPRTPISTTPKTTTPQRKRSRSSPISPAEITRLQPAKKISVLSPLLVSTPLRGLKKYGFMVVRKRRSTIEARDSAKKRTLSPLSRPSQKCEVLKQIKEQREKTEDYDLVEDNLCSAFDETSPNFKITSSTPIKSLLNGKILDNPASRCSLFRNSSPGIRMDDSPVSRRPRLQRSISLIGTSRNLTQLRHRNNSVNDFNLPRENLADIHPLMDRTNMTGDFARTLSLPLTIGGKHVDLKYIKTSALVDLLEGKHTIDYEIIDARYPYEFEGGHISGAKNIFRTEDITSYFFEKATINPEKKKAFIFHCEFSSERGPAMLKHLRQLDRKINEYPKLNYPEIYLLKDGYKEFFQNHSFLTTGSYVPMLDCNFAQELRKFRRTKSIPNGKSLLSHNS